MEHCEVCAADARFVRLAKRPDYESASSRPRIRVVDLFCGGGGLSLGLAEAARRIGRGTKIVAAVEIDPAAADVYALNFPSANLVRADVAALFNGRLGRAPTSVEARLSAQLGAVDVLLAGPPCQGHSDLNNYTRREDPRNDLYVRVARAAEILLPRVVLIENVPAVRHDVGGALQSVTSALERVGYRVAADVLDLVKLGIPQSRKRHVLLASRDRRVDAHAILKTHIACGLHRPRTVAWAIGDLVHIHVDAGPDAPSTPTAANAARMRWLIDHDAYDLPNGRRPPCHHNAHSYVSMYGRLRWDQPAQTITTGYGSMGQGRYVHPSDARTITPHEAARLQTIPDFFDLGSTNYRSTWARVIANSVPPLLGVHVGVPLLSSMFTKTGLPQQEVTPTASRSINGSRRAGVPAASSQAIQERMKRTQRRDTGPELKLRSELDRRGLSYLVDHPVDDGRRRRADVAFPDARVAVYVNGCFWHACPDHGTIPKANDAWWKDKLEANRSRDADTDARLEAAGWVVLRFWEHDDFAIAAARVEATVTSRSGKSGSQRESRGRKVATAHG